MRATRFLTLLFLLLVISGCNKPAEDLTELSNAELRKNWRACAYLDSASGDEIAACENYEKECDTRKEQGRLACY
ncbi:MULTISPECIES: hypothetical protein [Marinomonas]|uniref:Uncharacterized protein n=1 Tax=Marinomonas alcarazii TaxID=491949 RepID=A0A318UT88_9GAMM|nr:MULTISPECIES: hypothetical protein [Marinomonas]PYF78610.1 hypothetical protein DFP75_11129 [Marinomonas alcarazii]